MKKPEVIPLLTIRNEPFQQQYELGVWSALQREGPMPAPILDSYLVIHLKYAAACGYFASLQNPHLSRFGFCLGRYHGAVLASEATSLLLFSHEASRKGYQCGRRAYFTELSPQERVSTDEKLIGLFAQIMQDNLDCLHGGDDSLVYWCVGDCLGVLSGQLFPLQEQEQASWQRKICSQPA